MANLTRKVLRKLLAHSVRIGYRTDNPVTEIDSYKLGTRHTWTENELAVFERRWPLGTRERLAYALLLYTAQRGGDVVKMRRADISKGAISVVQQKTGTALSIPIHPELAAALKAGPANGLNLDRQLQRTPDRARRPHAADKARRRRCRSCLLNACRTGSASLRCAGSRKAGRPPNRSRPSAAIRPYRRLRGTPLRLIRSSSRAVPLQSSSGTRVSNRQLKVSNFPPSPSHLTLNLPPLVNPPLTVTPRLRRA